MELHRRQRLAAYDMALKGFRYHEALDRALESKHPRTIVAVMEELLMRRVRTCDHQPTDPPSCSALPDQASTDGRLLLLLSPQGLKVAVSGRDDAALEPILSFLARYLCHPDYSDVLLDVASIVLGGWEGATRSLLINNEHERTNPCGSTTHPRISDTALDSRLPPRALLTRHVHVAACGLWCVCV